MAAAHLPSLQFASDPSTVSASRCGIGDGGHIQAVVSVKNTVRPNSSGIGFYKLTQLEGNSWLWDIGGFVFLVDLILVGDLDFVIPWLYDGSKKFTKYFPHDGSPYVLTINPNTKPLLDPLFRYVRYLVSAPRQLTLYYEPHCIFNKDLEGKERADIVITPLIEQLLPSFNLVSGSLQELWSREIPGAQVLRVTPAMPLEI
ncbi:hypothetical protein MLD38_005494 [Melastoma candidum]|uniref:Uncharacterized protein n=1 Tax=Melastoma candidum TaxID=119954 RepID=A0ACB9RT89_9MYRT|nr:hypothetical protein MLD38_005494 [Melastoma candidum]